MNQARFNLANFNRTEEGENVQLAEKMFATLDSMIVNGADEYLTQSMAAQLKQDTAMGPAEYVAGVWSEKLNCSAAVIPFVFITAAMSAKLLKELDAGADVYISPEIAAKLNSAADWGLNVYLRIKDENALEGDLYLSVDIFYKGTGAALLNAEMDATVLSDLVAKLDVTIPAGGTLVIDSENFNVLLNGQNAIWVHTGDWITIEPETMFVKVTSSLGGPLECRILYTERYL